MAVDILSRSSGCSAFRNRSYVILVPGASPNISRLRSDHSSSPVSMYQSQVPTPAELITNDSRSSLFLTGTAAVFGSVLRISKLLALPGKRDQPRRIPKSIGELIEPALQHSMYEKQTNAPPSREQKEASQRLNRGLKKVIK